MILIKERIKYIDIARGIAMILVVMAHCDNFRIWSIDRFSSLFFMQLFIFISGMFWKNNISNFKDLIKTIKKKCIPIYIYYLKFEILFYLLTNFFIRIGFYNTSLSYGGKAMTLITSISEIPTEILKIVLFMGREPFCGAFWFLITLIFVIVGYSVINYLSRIIFKDKAKYATSITLVICFLIGCIMSYTISIPRISPTFTLIIFYHLGYYTTKHSCFKYNNIFICLISFILLNVLYFYGRISMNSNSFTDPLYLIMCSIFGIYMIMYISRLIDSKTKYIKKILSYIGKNTLPILALHLISFKVVMFIQYKLGQITYTQLGYLKGANNNNLLYILYILCGICIPLLLNKTKSITIQQLKKTKG